MTTLQASRGAGSATELAIERDGDRSIRLVVRGRRVALGDDLTDHYGFDDTRLDERMLRILVALAVRRRNGGQGWMTAEELGVLALAGASGRATAKQLEMALREVMRVGPRLIEYRPASASGGGRSRGPYRLGVAPEATALDEAACWSFLAGRALSEGVGEGHSLEVHLADARSALHGGRFVEAQSMTYAALRSIFEGTDELRRACDRDRCHWLAQAYLLLANIDLEIGAPRPGLLAAARARHHFDHICHPEGAASALLVEAHLRGQVDDPDESRRSFVAARNALVRLDDAGRAARRGVQRAAHIGTLGHRQSQLGQTKPAARRLLTAYRLCEAASSRTWAAIWAIRVGQNALAAGDQTTAERYMVLANANADALTPSGYAALTRGMGELHLITGQFAEAELWILRARAVGENLAMGHQRNLADRLLARLERRR